MTDLIPKDLFIKSFLETSFSPDSIPDRVIEEARRWVGVPFRHAGRDRLGIDCVGLPLILLRFLHYTDFEDTDYSRSVNPERMRREIELFCVKIEEGFENAQTADLFFFNIMGATQHIGVYTGKKDNTLIHAYESVGRVVEHIMNQKWINRIDTVYRLKGL